MKITLETFDRLARLEHRIKLGDPLPPMSVESPEPNVVDITIDGKTVTITEDKLHPGFSADFIAFETPPYFEHLQARLMVLRTLPSVASQLNPDLDLDQVTGILMSDAGTTIKLKRLKQSVRDNIVAWVWETAMTKGRTYAEKAAIVSNALGGANSVGRRPAWRDDKFLATYDRAHRVIKHVLWETDKIELPNERTWDTLEHRARDMLIELGMPQDQLVDTERLAAIEAVRLLRNHIPPTLVEARCVHMIMTDIGVDSGDRQKLVDNLIKVGSSVLGGARQVNGRSPYSLSSRLTALSNHLRYGTDYLIRFNQAAATVEDMEEFVESLLKSYVRKLQSRGRR